MLLKPRERRLGLGSVERADCQLPVSKSDYKITALPRPKKC